MLMSGDLEIYDENLDSIKILGKVEVTYKILIYI